MEEIKELLKQNEVKIDDSWSVLSKFHTTQYVSFFDNNYCVSVAIHSSYPHSKKPSFSTYVFSNAKGKVFYTGYDKQELIKRLLARIEIEKIKRRTGNDRNK